MSISKKFEYDFHKDVRVDISPKSLILTAFDKPVNYQQPVDKVLKYGCHNEFASEKVKRIPEITLKSGRKLPIYILESSVYKREYLKTFKKTYFSARKKIIGKNPEQDKCNLLCAHWGKFFKKDTLIDVTNYGADLDFLLGQPYRCSLAEYFGKNCESKISHVESINHDFLAQTKYLINPPVINMLARTPNIPANLSKSHVQLLACAEYYKHEELFYEILKMSTDDLIKLKKKMEKAHGPYDFRKYKEIRRFYATYQTQIVVSNIKLKSQQRKREVEANETEIEEWF